MIGAAMNDIVVHEFPVVLFAVTVIFILHLPEITCQSISVSSSLFFVGFSLNGGRLFIQHWAGLFLTVPSLYISWA